MKRKILIEKYIIRRVKIRRYVSDSINNYYVEKFQKTCPFQENDDIFVQIIRPIQYEKKR